ncbi:hypothetical protein B484DRAFT_431067 [Ochromonadaceae sp. CCMP2298]|nr:hypothetical protein B484DRAFT_431067 [Ochromonadaceae sp. CCMP2298]
MSDSREDDEEELNMKGAGDEEVDQVEAELEEENTAVTEAKISKKTVLKVDYRESIGQRFLVQYDSVWYSATLRKVKKAQGLMQFDDDGFDDEWVGFSPQYVRPVAVAPTGTKAPKEVAGAFQKDSFREFAESLVDEPTRLREFTYEEIGSLRSAVHLSLHSSERRDERYGETLGTLQEFERSMNAPPDCLYHEQSRHHIVFNTVGGEYDEAVEVTLEDSFSRFVCLKREHTVPAHFIRQGTVVFTDLELDVTVQKVVAAAKIQVLCHAEYFFLSGENASGIRDALQHHCYLGETIHVITNTSRLIFTKVLRKLVTCIPLKQGYSDWKKVWRQKLEQAKLRKVSEGGKKRDPGMDRSKKGQGKDDIKWDQGKHDRKLELAKGGSKSGGNTKAKGKK